MRATAPTLASMAKTSALAKDNPIGKRKREVLVEVTGVINNNGKKSGGMVKGKAKELEEIGQEVVSKLKQASKPVRESLRTLAGPVATRTHRIATASTTSTKRTVEVLRNTATQEAGTDRGSPRPDQRLPIWVIPTCPLSASDDAEAERVFKKRHTQSPIAIGGVQDDSQADADKIAAELVDIEEESEGKPQLWDDLDEGDWDDPTMVSEYVAEVCIYLKQIEVRIALPRYTISS